VVGKKPLGERPFRPRPGKLRKKFDALSDYPRRYGLPKMDLKEVRMAGREMRSKAGDVTSLEPKVLEAR
jgi:hypothetical protein